MTDPSANQSVLFEALLTGAVVEVTTETRQFRGRVWEMGRSPYENGIIARVVDHEGRVHYFRVERAEVAGVGWTWKSDLEFEA